MTSTQNDRRQLYRLQPAAHTTLELSLSDGAQRWPVARVVDVNLHGVRVSLRGRGRAQLAVGSRVEAAICALGLEGRAQLPGRVVFTHDEQDEQVVAIAFLARPNLGDRVTAEFFSVFNRRGDERERSAPAQARMSALVLNAAGEADGVIDLMVRDHSAKGVGFVVDAPTDAFLQDGASLALPRPHQREAVWPAQVRRRDARDDAVHYGCTFDDDMAR